MRSRSSVVSSAPRRYFWLALIALLQLVGLAGASAAPQTSEEDTCMLDDACNRLVKRAMRSSQQKQYEEALQLYQGAHALTPEPRLLLSVGRMQQKLGRLEEAQKSYQKFLRESTRPDD